MLKREQQGLQRLPNEKKKASASFRQVGRCAPKPLARKLWSDGSDHGGFQQQLEGRPPSICIIRKENNFSSSLSLFLQYPRETRPGPDGINSPGLSLSLAVPLRSSGDFDEVSAFRFCNLNLSGIFFHPDSFEERKWFAWEDQV